MSSYDPITLVVVLALIALLPTVVVVTTCFLKIAIVMSLIRNALGVQQIPPNMALYGMALIISVYIMAPVGNALYESTFKQPSAQKSIDGLVSGIRNGLEPLRSFMVRHSKSEQRDYFIQQARKLWGPDLSAKLEPTDFLILMPSFLVSELTSAFQIGFLLYLPFVVIDLIVSNILLAMGMMMVSPVTISLPLKLFLFVMVDGWSRLIHGLIMTYA